MTAVWDYGGHFVFYSVWLPPKGGAALCLFMWGYWDISCDELGLA